MKKNLFIWQVVGITFTAVLGTVLHFLYDWTNVTSLATISAVNESTWEHMKLVFVPSFIFAFMQYFWAKNDYPCFWSVKFIGTVLGTLLIPIMFYTLQGAFGTLSAITNIAIFFISIIAQYLTELFLFNKFNCKNLMNWLFIWLLVIILVLFIIFSFAPPKIPLFLDPVSNTYGITK